MIYVGLTKGIINATAHWYLAVTEDGTTFKNEDKDTLKEVLKCVEEMQKDTLKEVAICFDHWGASSWIAEIAEFVSKHEHLHLELTKVALMIKKLCSYPGCHKVVEAGVMNTG